MTKLKSNGFGSFQQLLAVSIDQYWIDELLKIKDSKLLQHDKSRSVVQIPLWTTRPNNDENVIWELRYMFTALDIPSDDWSIDWEKSSY